MRKIKLLLLGTVLAFGVLPFSASSAGAVVCHDYPGGCCGDVEVAGKTILTINC
jgi:hypothetical protein